MDPDPDPVLILNFSPELWARKTMTTWRALGATSNTENPSFVNVIIVIICVQNFGCLGQMSAYLGVSDTLPIWVSRAHVCLKEIF